MDIALLLSDPAQKFIRDHLDQDPTTVMLTGKGVPGIYLRELVQQIKGQKIAQDKIPQWFETPGLIYGPGKSLEQCSSELTGKYKSQLVSGLNLVDLTGGLGVDTFYLGLRFKQVTYVEEDPLLCSLAINNFKALGVTNTRVVAQSAEDYVLALNQKVDCVFIDPDRRSLGQRHYNMEDYRPNVKRLLPRLWPWTELIMLKLSAMQNIRSTILSLGDVQQIHVVSVKNDCKELIVLLKKGYDGETQFTGVNYPSVGPVQASTFSEKERISHTLSDPLEYLYEPNSSLMKLAAFGSIGQKNGIYKLQVNSHLYTSVKLIKSFPGRIFKIQWVAPYKPKEIVGKLASSKANVAVRNFPLDVKTIRKQLRLGDGGDNYLFFTTGMKGQLLVINGQRYAPPHTV